MFALAIPAVDAHGEEGDAAEKYPFIAQQAGNDPDHYFCAGLAGSIECLEEGMQVEGVESAEDLAGRLWNRLTGLDNEPLVYRRHVRLRDGTEVPVCSKAALEEIGVLVQDEYAHTVKTKLWQEQAGQPDPQTPDGRALLETRQKYLNLLYKKQENQITSRQELRDLLREDSDGLVALTGRGRRSFHNGAPRKVAAKRQLKIDPKTGKYPSLVPSNHAFLVVYDEDEKQFYVYDSDDADGKCARWILKLHFRTIRTVVPVQAFSHDSC